MENDRLFRSIPRPPDWIIRNYWSEYCKWTERVQEKRDHKGENYTDFAGLDRKIPELTPEEEQLGEYEKQKIIRDKEAAYTKPVYTWETALKIHPRWDVRIGADMMLYGEIVEGQHEGYHDWRKNLR